MRISTYPNNLQGILTSNHSSLANICRQLHYHDQLVAGVKTVLDPLVAFSYSIGQYKNNRLNIYVANHSQGQFLRFQKKAAIAGLKRLPVFADIAQMKIMVDSVFFTQNTGQKPAHAASGLSATAKPQNIQLIRQSARQVTNQNLARQLNSLAKTLQEHAV